MLRALFNRECGIRPKRPVLLKPCCDAPFNDRYACRECHLCRLCGTKYDFHLPYGDTNTHNKMCFECLDLKKRDKNKRKRVIAYIHCFPNIWERVLRSSGHSVEFMCMHGESSYRMCSRCIKILGDARTDLHGLQSKMDKYASIFIPYILDHFLGKFFGFSDEDRRFEETEMTLWDKAILCNERKVERVMSMLLLDVIDDLREGLTFDGLMMHCESSFDFLLSMCRQMRSDLGVYMLGIARDRFRQMEPMVGHDTAMELVGGIMRRQSEIWEDDLHV